MPGAPRFPATAHSKRTFRTNRARIRAGRPSGRDRRSGTTDLEPAPHRRRRRNSRAERIGGITDCPRRLCSIRLCRRSFKLRGAGSSLSLCWPPSPMHRSRRKHRRRWLARQGPTHRPARAIHTKAGTRDASSREMSSPRPFWVTPEEPGTAQRRIRRTGAAEGCARRADTAAGQGEAADTAEVTAAGTSNVKDRAGAILPAPAAHPRRSRLGRTSGCASPARLTRGRSRPHRPPGGASRPALRQYAQARRGNPGCTRR